ncbi:hypothetical protein MHK_006794, partial [Candidatus Magnetomorum sp. HK-1]
WTSMTGNTNAELKGISGTAENDIMAVGVGGMILDYNGSSWTKVTEGIPVTVYDVWGLTDNDLYAACAFGQIHHFNGEEWVEMSNPATMNLYSIWGNDENNIFAVGLGGKIIYYNGSTWSNMTSGTSSQLKGVWGSSSTNVFVVGHGGTILQYTGASWSSMTSNTAYDLYDIWGTAEDDVFVSGDYGTLLHYDGNSWTDISSGTSDMFAIWGTDSDDVFSVGQTGKILHYDGSSWTQLTSGTTENLRGVWGLSSEEVFTVGDTGIIKRYNGTIWEAQTSNTTNALQSVWCEANNNIIAVGTYGTAIIFEEMISIPDQTIDQDTAVEPISFSIIDADSDPLTVTKQSSDLSLIPVSNINVICSGENCTVAITPTASMAGSSIITLTVTDPSGLTSHNSFVLVVNDTTEPSVGNSGQLTIVTQANSVTITWTMATDNVSTTQNLSYRAYSSTYFVANDINSWENEAYAISDWIANTNTITISNLSNNETYSFAIMVMDETGNKSMYVVESVNLNTAPTISAISNQSLVEFIEEFADTDYANLSATNANWSTTDELLKLQNIQRLYGSFSNETVGSNITSYTDNTLAITMGDVNGDGLLDLITGSQSGQTIRLYLNNGSSDPYSGVVGKNITSDTNDTRALALGDLDYDGDLDLIAGNSQQTNRIYLNNGTNDPFNSVSGSDMNSYTYTTEALIFADMDADGDLDLIEANDGQQNLLYLNDGTLTPFDGVIPINITNDAEFSFDIDVGDIDQDGDLDIVVANESSYNKLYLNNGTADPFNGISGTNITSDINNTGSIKLRDMNGDSYLDVVCGNKDQINRIYLNNTTADPFNGVSGSDIIPESTNTRDIDIADIDGDGDLDIIEGNALQPNYLYLNNGTSQPFDSITRTAITNDAHDTRAVVIKDVNSDGSFDLIAGNRNLGTDGDFNRIYLNSVSANPFDGVTGVAITDTVSTFIDLIVADMNGDTHIDVIASNYNMPNVLYIHNGTADPFNGVTGTYITSDVYNARRIDIADMDNDGDIDLVVGNKDQANRLYLNNGTADPFNGITGVNITDDAHDTRVIAIADLDGDGDNDLVVGNYNYFNKLYFNNGTSTPFVNIYGVSLTHDWHNTRALLLEDIEGDGDIDILVGNLGQLNKLYINNGTDDPFHGETSLNISLDADNTAALAVGDVDNDGDIDVIVGNYNQINKLYLNNGIYDPFYGVSGQTIGNAGYKTVSLKLVDIDGDGDLDLIEGNDTQYNKLYLNNGTSAPFTGVTGLNFDSTQDKTLDIDTGDIDEDGDPDLVVLNENELNKYFLTAGVNALITNTYYDTGNNVASSIKLRPTGTTHAMIGLESNEVTNTSIDYFLSTDNSKFYQVQPDQLITFPNLGNGLYWSARLNTLSPLLTPEIYTLVVSSATSQINFNISDAQGGTINILCESSDESIVSNDGISIAGTSENDVDMWLAAGENKSVTMNIIGIPGQYGSSTITVTITDPQGLTTSTNFTATLNDPPIIEKPDDIYVDENDNQFQIPINISNSFGTITTVSAFSDNQSLIPNANLTVDSNNGLYTLNVQSMQDQYGSATITIMAIDSLSKNSTKTFDIYVNSIDKNPLITSIPDQNAQEDTIISIPFAVTDTNGGTLFIETQSDNLSLFSNYNILIEYDHSEDKQETTKIVTTSAGSPTWLTLTMIPESDQYGSAGITLTVTDNNGLTNVHNFNVNINSAEDEPQISMYANIAAGDTHTLALNADGTVWAWGNNSKGQLGDGTTTNRTTPVKVPDLTDVVSIGAGEFFSVAVKNDGSVWAWGWNDYGMLGIGTTDDHSSPVQVKGESGAGYLTNVVAVECGDHHTLALTSEGTIWSWGCNANGKLGDNSFTTRYTPVRVVGEGGVGNLSNIVQVYAGDSHSIALDASGNVWAWGSNINGQLGNGESDTSESIPILVENLAHVKAIAAGNQHCLALKTNGSVWVWGFGYQGQLGDGGYSIRTIPYNIRSLNNSHAIAAGGNTSAVLKSDGTAWAFGQNTYGQIGNATNSNQHSPVQLS